jgi:hypothetical protein
MFIEFLGLNSVRNNFASYYIALNIDRYNMWYETIANEKWVELWDWICDLHKIGLKWGDLLPFLRQYILEKKLPRDAEVHFLAILSKSEKLTLIH